jgi:hypothetical protein
LIETVFWSAGKDPETKPSHPRAINAQGGRMRNLIFSAALLGVASVGFYGLISASLAAARDARAATFSERFAPAFKSASCAARQRIISLAHSLD